MNYKGTIHNQKKLVGKHKGHVSDNKICWATSDGNCFIGDKAESHARSHSANYSPALEVYNLKSKASAKVSEEVLTESTSTNKAEAQKIETPVVSKKSSKKAKKS